jgi:hypothetical protein
MRRRVSFRTVLLWVMGAGLLGFVCTAGVALLDIQVSPVVTAAWGMSCIWVPTALCWTAVYRVRFRRPEVLLGAAAVTSWAVGSTYYLGLQPAAGPVPFPSFADVGSALFYTLMAAALVVAVRRQTRGVGSAVWWDAVVGSLGAAAVLAVVLNPLLARALTRTPSLTTLALAAYPLPPAAARRCHRRDCRPLRCPHGQPMGSAGRRAAHLRRSQTPSLREDLRPLLSAPPSPCRGAQATDARFGLGVRRESAESAAGPKNPKPPQPGNPLSAGHCQQGQRARLSAHKAQRTIRLTGLTRHSAQSGLQAGSFPSQRYRAAMRYDPDKTMLGTMLNDPEVVAILENHAPGITKNPMIAMAKGMTANQALVMGAGMIGGQQVVDAIRTEISQLG